MYGKTRKGSGNVGATVANVIAHKDLAKEVVRVDIKKGMAEERMKRNDLFAQEGFYI